jgi:hypothetical protein
MRRGNGAWAILVRNKERPMKRMILSAWVLWAVVAGAAPYSFQAREAARQPLLAGGSLSRLGTEISDYVRIPEDGWYEITVRASGRARDGLWPLMGVVVDGFALGAEEVATEEPRDIPMRAELSAGVWAIGAQMLNESDGFLGRTTLQLHTVTVAPVEGDATPGSGDEAAWLRDAQARDKAVLAAADASIAAHRVGKAVVEVVDGQGAPVAGATVSARLARHGFLFGGTIPAWTRWWTGAPRAAS